MQTIRQFMKGSDESTWVKVMNSAYKEYSDWRAITLQEFLAEEADSSFRSDERFVADIDGRPVGVLRVCLEDPKNGAKGLIETLAIVPEFRYLGIEERLVEIAVDEVRKKGARVVVAVDEKYNIERRTKTGIILGVGVLKSHRTKGIGTRLVLQGLETLRALGMTRTALDVDDFNQSEAKRLYEKVGFSIIESYLTYEMDMLHAQNHRPTE